MSDRIISHPSSEAYRENWERIFGKPKQKRGPREWVDESGMRWIASDCGCVGAKCSECCHAEPHHRSADAGARRN